MRTLSSRRARRGFTLIEILTAVTLLLVIMAVTASVMDRTTGIWRHANAKIEAFQNSRGSFDIMSSRLAQATLNTYWDYYDSADHPFRLAASPATFLPAKYGRYSDLHFVCGPAKTLVTTLPPNYTALATGAVFFTVPAGLTATPAYRGLPGLLTATGFFVAFGSDKAGRPGYLNTAESYRWRLMEVSSPAESLAVFTGSTGTAWFRDPIAAGDVRPVADNIIALIVWPRLSPQDDTTGEVISKTYSYDSRTTDPWVGAKQPVQSHQLPPTVQVTMVAIDEAAARRLENDATPPPAITAALAGLFYDNGDTLHLSAHYAEDLATLEKRLASASIPFRTFTSTIALRESKWSQ